MNIYEISLQGFSDLLEKQEAIKTLQDVDALKLMFKQRQPYSVNQGVANVHVFGPLKRNATELEKLTGITDYSDIASELELAEYDPTVEAVFIYFDSPGGEAIGSSELARYIENYPKPVIAIVNESVCMSAAYKLASACSYIIASESSEVGSIGSIVVLDNTKIAHNNMGIYKTVITNDGATLKGIGSDFGELSEEQQMFMQSKVNDSGKKFQDIVLSNRPEINLEVFNAGFYSADRALELGLIDQVINH